MYARSLNVCPWVLLGSAAGHRQGLSIYYSWPVAAVRRRPLARVLHRTAVQSRTATTAAAPTPCGMALDARCGRALLETRVAQTRHVHRHDRVRVLFESPRVLRKGQGQGHAVDSQPLCRPHTQHTDRPRLEHWPPQLLNTTYFNTIK